MPVPRNLLERIDKTSSPLHTGSLRNAIDFIVPEHTPVFAAANGIVTYVKDDSTIGGPDPIYQKYTNFITIMHDKQTKNIRSLGTSKLEGESRSNC